MLVFRDIEIEGESLKSMKGKEGKNWIVSVAEEMIGGRGGIAS